MFQIHNTILQASTMQLQASINAILQASIIAMSYILSYCCIIYKNVYSNPQYNPTSLCIKEMQNLLSTDESENF